MTKQISIDLERNCRIKVIERIEINITCVNNMQKGMSSVVNSVTR